MTLRYAPDATQCFVCGIVMYGEGNAVADVPILPGSAATACLDCTVRTLRKRMKLTDEWCENYAASAREAMRERYGK